MWLIWVTEVEIVKGLHVNPWDENEPYLMIFLVDLQLDSSVIKRIATGNVTEDENLLKANSK